MNGKCFLHFKKCVAKLVAKHPFFHSDYMTRKWSLVIFFLVINVKFWHRVNLWHVKWFHIQIHEIHSWLARLFNLMSLTIKLLSSYIGITIINGIYMIHIEEIMLGKSMYYHNQNLFQTCFPICLWDIVFKYT